MSDITTMDELREEAQYWADYFLPAVEDDNNYYRGECPVDGKDAAALGEFAATVVRFCDQNETDWRNIEEEWERDES